MKLNRRSLLSTTMWIAPAVALAACVSTLATVGSAIGSGAVAKVVSYVQGALTGLSMLAQTFLPTNTSVSSALASLQTFAASVGSSITANASWLTGTTAAQFGRLASAVVTALQTGLALLPDGATLTLALTALNGIASFIPTVVSFINSLVSPAKTSFTATGPAIPSYLRIMVP